MARRLWQLSAGSAAILLLLGACAGGPPRDRDAEAEAVVSFSVPGAASVSSQKFAYRCDGVAVQAEYINAADVALAVLSIEDEFVVASNVLSASGARYAGGRFIWWTKGDAADLYDLTKGEDAPPLHCVIVE